MNLNSLITLFEVEKNTRHENLNELLDFVQRKYISNNLTFNEYKSLFFELDSLGAKKPS